MKKGSEGRREGSEGREGRRGGGRVEGSNESTKVQVIRGGTGR